jgi:hypothetical protein
MEGWKRAAHVETAHMAATHRVEWALVVITLVALAAAILLTLC